MCRPCPFPEGIYFHRRRSIRRGSLERLPTSDIVSSGLFGIGLLLLVYRVKSFAFLKRSCGIVHHDRYLRIPREEINCFLLVLESIALPIGQVVLEVFVPEVGLHDLGESFNGFRFRRILVPLILLPPALECIPRGLSSNACGSWPRTLCG